MLSHGAFFVKKIRKMSRKKESQYLTIKEEIV